MSGLLDGEAGKHGSCTYDAHVQRPALEASELGHGSDMISEPIDIMMVVKAISVLAYYPKVACWAA